MTFVLSIGVLAITWCVFAAATNDLLPSVKVVWIYDSDVFACINKDHDYMFGPAIFLYSYSISRVAGMAICCGGYFSGRWRFM